MRKTYCILEQGNNINDPLTLEKKELFNTSFSSFYRLNWQKEEDPNAFITHKNITWSEGRSLLFESVPKNYDYYIFTDDDVIFTSDHSNVAEKIRDILLEFKPITGTFYDNDQWMFNSIPSKTKDSLLSRRAFPIAGYDLQLQIFSEAYAKEMFPVIFHGSGKSMWYSQWICNQILAPKQMCFTEVKIKNGRHIAHFDHLNDHFASGTKLMWLFNNYVNSGHKAPYHHSQLIYNNSKAFEQEVSKEKLEITRGSIADIFDVNSYFYRERTATVNEEYLHEVRKFEPKWKSAKIRLKLLFLFFRLKNKLISS